jgi:mRNA interferase ChpB
VKRGEIWLVSLDPTAVHEQQGTRPVLIVSPDEFNRVIGMPVVLAITSGGAFARTRGFAVSLHGVGTATTGVIRCDQLRSVDMAARKGRFLEAVPQAIIDEVLMKLARIFA